MNDERYMRMALDACRAGVDRGQSPFGACIVDAAGQVLACEHNHVWQDTDPSAHAEVCALRQACRGLNQLHLEDATIYSTTEPCPMCFSAIHWSRLNRIVFAATVADAASFGFNELRIDNATMKRLSDSRIELTGDVLRDAALDIYRHWQSNAGKVY